ncbi:MAG: RNA 2',3'-cyclic phosphodiesterase [Thermodesulfobacteriota bacterium]|nr:RNA 2',3'-cyclic phosphodiesterase [Thermodesulfobacteriota bacterium]
MNDRKSVRTFLAIDLPPGIKYLIEGIKEKLTPALKGIRWIRPEAMHLTLKFFGDVSQDDVVHISEVVERNVRDIAPMVLNVDSPGGFPSLENPRVLWLGIGGDVQRLEVLQAAIERDLEECGFPGEKRSFKPHLTLGRARSHVRIISGAEALIGGIKKLGVFRFDVRELILFESELKPGGAIYTKLAGFPFGGQGETG